ncbi:MAG: serine/threonine protein kinase [Deltaproteobacteria bacterium]|nr:serine/threonine protein kinase [Deltaproteobacteria bacterium]
MDDRHDLPTGDAGAIEAPTVPSLEPLASDVLRPGTRLGRYVLGDVIGIGGMATVHAAWDPELARQVALKVLRVRADAGDMRRDLLREAQALALLSDPHVVPIYDVGIGDDRLFIAMPELPGGTLAAWLQAESRPWPAIVAMFVAAGRGLAAAHAVGLVHGDFKPTNVLIDADALPRVVDFGLARRRGEPPAAARDSQEIDIRASSGALAVPLSDARTQDGFVRGTPVFMAPEQARGGALEARTDQFSFCVALFWALFDQHPFAAEDEADARRRLQQRIAAGAIADVTAARAAKGIPRRLLRVLRRGLAADVERRWPSMSVLLERITASCEPRGQLWSATAAAAVLGVVAIAWVGRAPGPTCDGATALGDAWSPERGAFVATRLRGLSTPYAGETAALVVRDADAWAQAWREAYEHHCAAEDDGARAAALACLAEQRAALRTTAAMLERIDERRLPHAMRSVEALGRPSDCDAGRSELEPASASLRVAAAEIGAMDAAGEYDAALAAARALVAEADAPAHAGDDEIGAVAHRLLGGAYERVGAFAEAERELDRAVFRATQAGRDDLAAEAMADLIKIIGVDLGRIDDAAEWSRHADATLARLDGDDRVIAAVRNAQALLALQRGELDVALAMFEQVIERSPRGDVAADGRRATAFNNYANVLLDAGRWNDARDAYEHALALREARLGPHHPDVAATLSNLGLVAQRQGDNLQARVFHTRALQVARESLGEDHPMMAELTNNLAVLDYAQGNLEPAQAGFERTLVLIRRLLSPDHPAIGKVLGNLALVHNERGEPAAALPLLDEAIALQERLLGADHADVAQSLNARGSALRRLGRLDEARADYERALRIRTAALGAEHSETAGAIDNLGLVALAQGHLDEAAEDHGRALAIWSKQLGERHAKLVGVLLHLATTVRAQGDLVRARGLVARAQAIASSLDGLDPVEAARVELALAEVNTDDVPAARRLARRALDAFGAAGSRADVDAERARALLHRLGG